MTPVIKVQAADFDIGAEIAALTQGNTAIGGVASFIGLVRDIA
ncbi:MAG: molybdenum cofactor biosynthesis protein MoaE, partial [Rhodospirillaceae bacterium]|nr:molybdenum cofactor biosynthesis protein MoaE [Rhodospirillaceae bacterium]